MTFWNWVLIIVGALLVLVEVALGGFAGFDLVLIGAAFVLGGAAGLATGSTVVGFTVASLLCIVAIVFGRSWVRRRMAVAETPSNVDALIGRAGVVVQRVARHGAGQVRVDDELWRAEPAGDGAAAFEPGAEVTVAGVHGVTLLVR